MRIETAIVIPPNCAARVRETAGLFIQIAE